VFADHDTVTLPLPLPLVGDTVSQEPFPDAVRLPPVQPVGLPMIDTLADPLLAPGLALAGDIEKLLQGGGAAGA
jgi:hypothetical protein